MSINQLNMLQTQGQMQSQDLQLKQNQVTALNKSGMSEAEKEKKLREACEGFESIFIQKMWTQMRATLPQENPLVGREEKFWQSMYDQELSKQMASSGGVGLADMMYDQLSKNLVSASRTTADGVSKNKGFAIAPTPLMPQNNTLASADVDANKAQTVQAKVMTTDIYEGAAQATGNNTVAQASTTPNVAANTVPPMGGSTPLVDQYLTNLMAKQNGGQAHVAGTAANNLPTGPELARQAQLAATNTATNHGVLPKSTPMSGHALQAQNAFVHSGNTAGNVGNTGAALLQSQIGGQPMENVQPHIVRATYTTNVPENQRVADKKVKQLLTSGQPMVRTLNTPNYAYGSRQTSAEQNAKAVQGNVQASPATLNTQSVGSQSATQTVSQNTPFATHNTGQVAQTTAPTVQAPNVPAPVVPIKTADEG